MIRLATLSDANQAVKLLLNFHKACDLPFEVTTAWALALFKACVNDKDKIAILKEDGGILLGIVGPSLVGPFVQCMELAWWVEPDKRGGSLAMLKMYEEWAKQKGAKLIEVKSMHKFPDTGKIYAKLGYEPIEMGWVKTIN
jgi:RimJ/RimL family protein N-acetyltransferase